MSTEHEILVSEEGWRHGDLQGTVVTFIPIKHHLHYTELAILARPGLTMPMYGARIRDTEEWQLFYNLQPWMFPVVQKLVELLAMNERVFAYIDQAHAIAHPPAPDPEPQHEQIA